MIEIWARNFTATQGRQIDLIVLHCMQSGEKPGTARQTANMWAGEKSPKSSAHYCCDKDEIIQCVPDMNIAWAAPGANKTGLHIEFAGMAEQGPQQWFDGYSRSMLRRAVPFIAAKCVKYAIPPAIVTADGLIHGLRGITTHAAVSRAFRKSTHWDPGPDFPLNWFVGKIRQEIEG